MQNQNYTSIEKQAMNRIFYLKSIVKGLKHFIDSKGGIMNCKPATGQLLAKWEKRLKQLTHNKEQKKLNF